MRFRDEMFYFFFKRKRFETKVLIVIWYIFYCYLKLMRLAKKRLSLDLFHFLAYKMFTKKKKKHRIKIYLMSNDKLLLIIFS